MKTILLLICSNVFMTVAWYGHLKYKSHQLWVVILLSWLIALPEYCLAVPANRIGSYEFSLPQLKIIQEAITLLVFVAFSLIFFRTLPRWNEWLALVLIFLAVFVMQYFSPPSTSA